MPNRLARETSPYLLQHADNPVDWYPWGEEALQRAQNEDKPILLSIGYSACHWCHVMARESFEDAPTADLMNRLFVNVKVDREERPDLDQIYQLAHQMMTQRAGGWPLTVFLTPRQEPFFAGTYFPKQTRYKLPGFTSLCERVERVWREQRDEIGRHALQLRVAISGEADRDAAAAGREPALQEAAALDGAPIDAALAGLKSSYDAEHGGFGMAPKFPHPGELQFCLRRHAANGDAETLQMVVHTLERMAQGGLFDQLGGGFYRYSTDTRWCIPHFEKMLCDNALLLGLYVDAFALTGNELFSQVVERTAGWVMREMQTSAKDGGGGYCSSLDADSEHQEGRFYVWNREQIRAILDPREFALAALHYGLDKPPNFEEAWWHLNVDVPLEAASQSLGIAHGDGRRLLDAARAKLIAARGTRIRPACDDKILTGWNALMIAAMARAGHVFDRADWIDSARAAMRFVRHVLWRDGRLLATAREDRAHLNAYLDDHATLLAASIEILQQRFEPGLLAFALQLGDLLLARFEDTGDGGFFFTSDDHEPLLARMKPPQDGAQPSGNGVATLALIRLALLTGERRFADAAQKALFAHREFMQRAPDACCALQMALEEQLTPTRIVVLRGPAEGVEGWQKRLAKRYLPHTLVLAVPEGIEGVPEVLAKPVRAGVNAWVCQGVTCLEPVDRFEALNELIL